MPEVAKGLQDVVVADTQLSKVEGDVGRLTYCGYDVHDLARGSTFEETTYLLWFGSLPTGSQLAGLGKELSNERALSASSVRTVRELKGAHPMGVLRTLVSQLGNEAGEPATTTPQDVLQHGRRALPRLTTIAATHYRLRQGREPVPPRDDLGHAANFLYMMHGREPTPKAARAMDVALVLHADHGFNASTFSARVTSSTLANLYAALTAAIGTLSGPLHGGANSAVMKQLEEIGSADRVPAWLDAKLGRHERVMGFGHRVYKVMDPRAEHLKRLSHELCREAGLPHLYEITAALEAPMMQRKQLYPNVDLYSASLYRALGIPPEYYTPIFAISRVAGWVAHVAEQMADNRLIRPRSNYVGAKGLAYVPINQRA